MVVKLAYGIAKALIHKGFKRLDGLTTNQKVVGSNPAGLTNKKP